MGAAEHRPPRPDQDCSGRHQHDHRLGNPRSRWTSSCALGSSGKLERLDARKLLAAVLEFVRFQIPRTLPSVTGVQLDRNAQTMCRANCQLYLIVAPCSNWDIADFSRGFETDPPR